MLPKGLFQLKPFIRATRSNDLSVRVAPEANQVLLRIYQRKSALPLNLKAG